MNQSASCFASFCLFLRNKKIIFSLRFASIFFPISLELFASKQKLFFCYFASPFSRQKHFFSLFHLTFFATKHFFRYFVMTFLLKNTILLFSEDYFSKHLKNQCCGAGAASSRIILLELEPQ
jgi:hypothetical protein